MFTIGAQSYKLEDVEDQTYAKTPKYSSAVVLDCFLASKKLERSEGSRNRQNKNSFYTTKRIYKTSFYS